MSQRSTHDIRTADRVRIVGEIDRSGSRETTMLQEEVHGHRVSGGILTSTTRQRGYVVRVIIFLVLSTGLIYVSRASLKVPRSHGFYRFLAWECILGLFVMNFVSFRQWFGDPLCPRQLVSWALLIGCVVVGVYGIKHLRARGRVDAGRNDDETLAWIEKTTRLVTTGVFRYIRHPLYSSLLLVAWGVYFKDPSWLAVALALAATVFLVRTARIEEAENIRYFGDAYREYMRHSKMFLPFVF